MYSRVQVIFIMLAIIASFCYFLCANIENVAKSVYDFTHFTQVILKSIYAVIIMLALIAACLFIWGRLCRRNSLFKSMQNMPTL